jgi:hypothetical protein
MIPQPNKPVLPAARQPTTSMAPAKPLAGHVSYETKPEPHAARDTGTPEGTDIAQVIRKTFRESVETAKGVVLVTCTDPTIVAVAVAAIVNGIHTNGTISDQPIVPVATITLPHSSGSREVESVKSYARRDIQAGKLNMERKDHCRRLNPLSPEGVHFLMSHMKPGGCVVAIVEYRNLQRDDAIAALAEINSEAQKLGVLVVICVLHTQKQDAASLRDHCAVCVVVRKCEPGPGAQIAIVLDNTALAGRHDHGIGRVMIEASLEPDGTWTFTREPFIAERAIIRLAWFMLRRAHLSKANLPLAKIAQVIGISPSNISRGIGALLISPKNALGVAPPTGWVTRWAKDYDLEPLRTRESPNQGATDNGAPKPQGSVTSQDAGRVTTETPALARTRPAPPTSTRL